MSSYIGEDHRQLPLDIHSIRWDKFYDINIVLIVFVPSFLSLTSSSLGLTPLSVLADILVLAEITWIISCTVSWPILWAQRLGDTRNNLLNYTNSVKLGLNVEPEPPELALNKKVLVANLQLVEKLGKFERLAWILAVISVPFCTIAMMLARPIIHSSVATSVIFSDSVLAIFFFWCTFRLGLKLSARYLASVDNIRHGNSSDLLVTSTILDLCSPVSHIITPEKVAARKQRSPKRQKLAPKSPSPIKERPKGTPKKASNPAFTPFPLPGSLNLAVFKRKALHSASPSILPTIKEKLELESNHEFEKELREKYILEGISTSSSSEDGQSHVTKLSLQGLPFKGSLESLPLEIYLDEKLHELASELQHVPRTSNGDGGRANLRPIFKEPQQPFSYFTLLKTCSSSSNKPFHLSNSKQCDDIRDSRSLENSIDIDQGYIKRPTSSLQLLLFAASFYSYLFRSMIGLVWIWPRLCVKIVRAPQNISKSSRINSIIGDKLSSHFPIPQFISSLLTAVKVSILDHIPMPHQNESHMPSTPELCPAMRHTTCIIWIVLSSS